MRISEDQLYHGAALTQIAEFPTFKAINSFSANGEKSRSAFVVNHDTGIYLKYATSPTKRFREFVFTFTEAHLTELAALKASHERVFIVLVLRKVKEICVLTLEEFEEHRSRRENAKGAKEPRYQLLVTAPANKSFRVYMNVPGKKKTALKMQVVSRSDFPKSIFSKAAS